MCVLARLTHAKFQKLACACLVACNFDLRMWASDTCDTQEMHVTSSQVAFGLPHYTYVM